ncbi:bifunctional peptidase and arginyl-hydroxylase JMJD5-like [Ylistrum balloti]|uniref:bifunctional peptidase and arginyl-hydroxylase JMJD5-like n=1 Tax=Ylistrum balloti TaxID=509963 RepID=UPI002905E43B|nr:bifunctional peptidase and arginyl-hydroxylase JMJD5-like [Ylistrum balloti]
MAASLFDRSRCTSKIYCYLLFSLFCNIAIASIDSHDIFTPNDILSSVDNTCLVLLTEFSNMDTSDLFDNLAIKTFVNEPLVQFGLIETTTFVWPGGKTLSEDSTKSKSEIIIFERRIADRTCLLMRKNPSSLRPIFYSGFLSQASLIDFINTHCHTYRSPDGGLSIEGHHRKEILNTLFSVAQVSRVTMGKMMDSHNTPADISEEALHNQEKMQNNKDIHEDNSCFIHEDGKCDKKDFNDKQFYKHEDIPQCERISEPTKEQFFHEYLKISKPVIIEKMTKTWPAFQKWTNNFFKKEYGNRDVYIKLTPKGEFEGVEQADLWDNFNTFSIPPEVIVQLHHSELVVVRPASLNLKFSEFLDTIEKVTRGDLKNVSAYLEYSSIPQHLPELEDDIREMPFVNPRVHKLEHLNIWLSDGNTLGKLHFDPYDNFLCQVHGQKQVILFEPHQNENLYEAHIQEAVLSYNETTKEFRRSNLVDSTSMVMSPVDILKPDFEKFPRFRSAMPLNCTLKEGDVLFMPSFWWHEVQSSPNGTAGHNLAVNFWYDPFLTKEYPCPECRLDINPRYRHLL